MVADFGIVIRAAIDNLFDDFIPSFAFLAFFAVLAVFPVSARRACNGLARSSARRLLRVFADVKCVESFCVFLFAYRKFYAVKILFDRAAAVFQNLFGEYKIAQSVGFVPDYIAAFWRFLESFKCVFDIGADCRRIWKLDVGQLLGVFCGVDCEHRLFHFGKFVAEGDSPRLGIFRYQRIQNRKRSSARASVHCVSHAVLQARGFNHCADVV